VADDAPFIAPLGDFAPPAVEVEPDRIVTLLVTALYERPGGELELFYGAAGNPADGRPWRAIVTVEYRELRWMLSAGAARQVAARIAQDRTLAWAFGDRGRLADLFTETADQAEALARGQVPCSKGEVH